CQHGYGSPFTF
nr:immunoglobulin light chain junction region [Macaca mulatta]MOW53199.1 immunoglobulin light chain junction region [Macaca mulatta]MOW56095.1 immunoglobulin light chain junction region [Macaca mulatta]MPN93335.1 immunoglobulin light chain junction region [Macaca mulatta]